MNTDTSAGEIAIKIEVEDGIMGGFRFRPVVSLYLDDECGTLSAWSQPGHDNGTPMTVVDGRAYEWSRKLCEGDIAIADEERLTALADRIQPLAARVIAGHSYEWDGGNPVGTLTEDALAAHHAIGEIFDRLVPEDWHSDLIPMDAREWIAGNEAEGITHETTDEELKAIAAADEAEAAANDVILDGTTLDARTEKRDELRFEHEYE